jgi:Uma2 family endonuclease
MAAPTLEEQKSLFPLLDDSMEHLADASGFKLEITNGIPTWEAFPVYRHQQKTLDIQLSLIHHAKQSSGCACIHVADLTIQFPDGSVKRPDISIFCHEPTEKDKACTDIPEVVIEIISKGYEKKDTEISLPFYLSYNIPDVVLFDPETNRVSHYHNGQTDEYDSPVELTFACGCCATI